MAYFPFYMDIAGKRGVILGGGRIAAGKIAALLPFSPQLVCIAPVICEEIGRLAEAGTEEPGSLRLITREAKEEDLEGAFFVIAATDSPETNVWAAKLCRERGILINAVDDRRNCSFYFPALVKRGPVVVGISTGGCSPAAASWLRRKAERMVPEEMGAAVERLGELRDRVKKSVPRPEGRAELLKRLFAFCGERDFRLDAGELEKALEAFMKEERKEAAGDGQPEGRERASAMLRHGGKDGGRGREENGRKEGNGADEREKTENRHKGKPPGPGTDGSGGRSPSLGLARPSDGDGDPENEGGSGAG